MKVYVIIGLLPNEIATCPEESCAYNNTKEKYNRDEFNGVGDPDTKEIFEIFCPVCNRPLVITKEK